MSIVVTRLQTFHPQSLATTIIDRQEFRASLPLLVGHGQVRRRDNQRKQTLQDHIVRIGVLGQIGRFRAIDSVRFQRGIQVICRTGRGLEFGTVLSAVDRQNPDVLRTGTILRAATPEDHLLWGRIEKHRTAAFSECQRLLDRHAPVTTLMDVELLFDGKSIFFYFLGAITSEIEELISELAETYEAQVQLRQFAEAMTLGCGPDCGTKEGGCEAGGCSSCSIAKACSPKRS